MLLVHRGLRPGRPQVKAGGASRTHRHPGAAAAAGRRRIRSRCRWGRWRLKRVAQLTASGPLLLSLVVGAVRGRARGCRRCRCVVAGHGPRSSQSSCMIYETISSRKVSEMRVFSLQLTLPSAVHHRVGRLVPLPRLVAVVQSALLGWRPSFFEGARSTASSIARPALDARPPSTRRKRKLRGCFARSPPQPRPPAPPPPLSVGRGRPTYQATFPASCNRCPRLDSPLLSCMLAEFASSPGESKIIHWHPLFPPSNTQF